jgi:hypothetical protein
MLEEIGEKAREDKRRERRRGSRGEQPIQRGKRGRVWKRKMT